MVLWLVLSPVMLMVLSQDCRLRHGNLEESPICPRMSHIGNFDGKS